MTNHKKPPTANDTQEAQEAALIAQLAAAIAAKHRWGDDDHPRAGECRECGGPGYTVRCRLDDGTIALVCPRCGHMEILEPEKPK